MSKILRRPMFRGGGKVSSYGKGITTGLTNGYAGGGQIGGGYIHGAAFPDGRYGFKNPSTYSQNWKNIDWKNAGQNVKNTGANIVKTAKDKVAQGASKTTNLYNKSKKFIKSKNFSEKGIMKGLKKYGPKALKYGKGLGIGALTRFPLITAGVAGEYITRPKDVDKLVYEQENYGPWEGRFRKILDPTYNKKWMNAAEKYYTDKDEAPTGIIGPPGGGDPEMKYDAPDPAEVAELTMKQQVEKDKALFADLLGEGEARGKDVSDMLLRFAGSGGNTVGEKFQQYIGNEAQAGPSRTEKINQAAASLAINDYISGKRSKENMEMMLKKTEHQVDYSIDAQKERDTLKGKDFVEAVGMEATAQKKKPSDNSVIASVIYKQTGAAPTIVNEFANKDYNSDLEIDETKLNVGLNIVKFKNKKVIIRKNSDNTIEIATEYSVF